MTRICVIDGKEHLDATTRAEEIGLHAEYMGIPEEGCDVIERWDDTGALIGYQVVGPDGHGDGSGIWHTP